MRKLSIASISRSRSWKLFGTGQPWNRRDALPSPLTSEMTPQDLCARYLAVRGDCTRARGLFIDHRIVCAFTYAFSQFFFQFACG